MGLIRAADAPKVVRFAWRDIEADAKKIVDEATARGEQIMQEARAQADVVREAARVDGFQRGHTDGFDRGRDEGRRAAMDEYSQQLELTIAALHEAVGETVQIKEQIRSESIGELVELAIAIAQRVTKRQAMLDPQVLIANLREAMGLVGRQKQVRVAIHPSQRQVLSAALPELGLEWPALGAAQIVDDASLLPGGCRVFTEHGQIDADLQSQLDRVVAGLMPPPSQGAAA